VDPLFFFLLSVQKVWFKPFIMIQNIACCTISNVILVISMKCLTCSKFSVFLMQKNKCIVINWGFTKLLVALRSMNDFIHFLNIILQVTFKAFLTVVYFFVV